MIFRGRALAIREWTEPAWRYRVSWPDLRLIALEEVTAARCAFGYRHDRMGD